MKTSAPQQLNVFDPKLQRLFFKLKKEGHDLTSQTVLDLVVRLCQENTY